MTLSPETFSQMEYEALRAEERDRMNSRAQVWTLFLSVVGAFGFVALQGGGMTQYITALCPYLLACLARMARHSEDVLRQVRKYLYELEKRSGYGGYEHWDREVGRPRRRTRGGHMVSLRDAFLLTDLLATASVLFRLYVDQAPPLTILCIIAVELIAVMLTCRSFANSKKKRSSQPDARTTVTDVEGSIGGATQEEEVNG